MKFIKLNRDCMYGKKDATVQVADYIAKERVECGHAVIVDEPKRKAHKKTSDRAMSAPE